MSVAGTVGTGSFRLVTGTAERIRADAVLYLFIALYTIAGLAFLAAVGALDRAAYSIYVVQWAIVFGMMMPTIALLIDTGAVVHRFNRRRGLVFRRVFSAPRLAHFLSGISLMAAIMVFEGTFTSVKNALVVWQGGFPYDKALADLDMHLHFGVDPWRWLYAMAGTDTVRAVVEFNYNVLWFVLCFSTLFFVATSPRAAAIRTRYVLCFMLVWIVVGNILAGLFMSAGPAFYGHVTGDTARFAGQLDFLAHGVGSRNSAATIQNYLWTLYSEGRTGFGSGISAFPSVHVGMVTLNAMFAWEYSRRLGIAAFAYVAFVAASSVYLGWHYAVDGYVSAAVTVAICLAVRRCMPDGLPFRDIRWGWLRAAAQRARQAVTAS